MQKWDDNGLSFCENSYFCETNGQVRLFHPPVCTFSLEDGSCLKGLLPDLEGLFLETKGYFLEWKDVLTEMKEVLSEIRGLLSETKGIN